MHLDCSNSKKTVAPHIGGAHIPMILVYILLQPVVIRGAAFSEPKAFHFIDTFTARRNKGRNFFRADGFSFFLDLHSFAEYQI